jgi:uncharacterized protein YutE (UPF0331/DUF86 family)
MTPRRLDRDVVGRRLRLLRDALDDLEALRGVTPQRLTAEPLVRAAAERLIQVAVDLAVDINGHIAVTSSGRAPATGRESFEAAAAAGALDEALALGLAPSAGLRNLLVHRYADIEVDLVAAAVGEVLDGFGRYVREVAAYVQAQSGPDGGGGGSPERRTVDRPST